MDSNTQRESASWEILVEGTSNAAPLITPDYSFTQQKKAADIKLDSLGICTMCTNPQNFFKFSTENLMHPRDFPNNIKDLTNIKHLLVTQIHPVISMYKMLG